MTHISLEFARRGFVVITIDPLNSGDSSSSAHREGGAIAQHEGIGAFDLLDYIWYGNVMNYIDRTRIGVFGHSLGGNAALQVATRYGINLDLDPSDPYYGRPRVRAVFVSGWVLNINQNLMGGVHGVNMAFDYPLWDEGAFRNRPPPGGQGPSGDMTTSLEALDFVNSVLTTNVTEVEIGRIYGNPNLGTMRQVFNVRTIHAMQPYVAASNTNMLDFFNVAMDIPGSQIANNWIPSSNHIWHWKEVFTTMALIGAFMFLVPFSVLLFQIPFFKKVRKPVPAPRARRAWWEKLEFWIATAITATVAAITFVPLVDLAARLFPYATNSRNSWFFPQRMNNVVMLWAAINGIIGMIVFLITFFGTHYLKKHIKKRRAAKGLDEPAWATKDSEHDKSVPDVNFGMYREEMAAEFTDELDEKGCFIKVEEKQEKKRVVPLMHHIFTGVLGLLFLIAAIRAPASALSIAGIIGAEASVTVWGVFAFLMFFAYLGVKSWLVHKTFRKNGKLNWWLIGSTVGLLITSLLFFILPAFNVTTPNVDGRTSYSLYQIMFNVSSMFTLFILVFVIMTMIEISLYIGRLEKINIDHWGIKLRPLDMFKTILMFLLIVGVFYLMLHIIHFFFHIDFRFLFILGVRPVGNIEVVIMLLMYIPFYFIFYISNSIRVNANREKGQREWVSLLIAGFTNIVGLIAIFAIQYIVFIATGTVNWTDRGVGIADWLLINILFGLIPVMFLLPLFNRWFFRATGRTWLGPMVTCFIFIMMALNNSVAYIPIW